MSCPICGAGHDSIRRPVEPSAMEVHLCTSCGHEFAVHCQYPIPEEYWSKNKIFLGTYTVPNENEVAKSYIKLTKILRYCEWFQLSKLEQQRIEGKKTWELGQFLDVEVERIKEECRAHAISICFVETN